LKTIAPLVTNDEFVQTKQVRLVLFDSHTYRICFTLKIVERFRQQSQPLQELLLKRAQIEENWVRLVHVLLPMM
jgi:hypothetical protein